MNAERLLKHYDRIADAPDAIARLRRFILGLAVRGKLVMQDTKDEPASKLLNRLHQERTHQRKFAQIAGDELEMPLPELPVNWLWTTVDQISADDDNSITDGPFGSQLKTDHYVQEAGFRVIRLQNIGGGIFRADHHSYIDQARYERLSKHHVRAGDLVVAGLVDPSVRCCQVPVDMGPALVKADCYRLAVHPELSSRYVLHFLNSPLAEDFAAVHHHGMTLTRIGLGNFRRIPIPLPPLAEQHRIVVRVDELMILCDRLEAAQQTRESARDRLTAASLARLNAPDPETLQADTRFVLDALPDITSRPDQVKKLRQTILNLAICGKLVQQNLSDEPASNLLKRIEKEKARLLKAGELKKITSVDDLTTSDHGISAPRGWVITSLQSICNSVTDGDHLPPPKAEKGVPFLVIGNVRNRRIDFAGSRFVSLQYFEALDPIRRPRGGDLLYTLVGSYGIPVIVRDDRPFCVQRHIGILRPSSLIDVNFLALVMESRLAFDQATAFATGIAQKTVPLSGLRALLVPLPPLPEQRRIVAKVDALMALCDRLEASLTAAADTRRRLLDALLAEALAPAEDRELQAAE